MTAGLSSPEPEDSGTVARDAAFLPGGVTPGATSPPDSSRSATGFGQDGSGDLRAEEDLAQVMDPNAWDDDVPMWPGRRVERRDASLAHAIAAIGAGHRRVVEDATTAGMVREF